MKRYILFVLFSCLIYTLKAQTATAPTLGDGSAGDPYQIATLDNLYWLSQQEGVMNATSTYWEKYYIQTANIDASSTSGWDSGKGFSPIGNGTTSFTGSYDGNGFTIDGLTILRYSPTPYDNIGLFGRIGAGGSPANVQNLGVTNVNIQGSISVGGLIGAATSGSIVSDCYSNGTVSLSAMNVGGLVGLNYGSTLTNCYSTVEVSGGSRVGGLVGYNYFNATIQRCYSTGDVGANGWAGGLVGQNDGGSTTKITDCYSTGDVNRILVAGTPTFGGFCGQNDLIIRRCYSTGSVTYAGTTDPTNAGFVGFDNSGSYTNNFWDFEASNQTTATGATAKTTPAMKTHRTFTDEGWSTGLSLPVWDFVSDPYDDSGTDDYWDIDYSAQGPTKVSTIMATMAINDNYPFLDFQNGTDTALPVELSSFTVEATNQGVLCEWTTESEIENLGFILGKKTEGTDWREIASYKTNNSLLGQGTTSSYTDYEYLDVFVEPNTTYEYRLADIDYDGFVTYHATRTITVGNTIQSSLIKEFTVLPAYPNPFNPSTTITYGLDTDSKVSVQIYDITGQLISTLQNEYQIQGWHSVVWNGTNQHGEQAPAGLYFSRIVAGNDVKTSKLMLLK